MTRIRTLVHYTNPPALAGGCSVMQSKNTPPKLLDQIRDHIRVKHYSIFTEAQYMQWIKRFILFHGKHRWVRRRWKGWASTQNQVVRFAVFV